MFIEEFKCYKIFSNDVETWKKNPVSGHLYKDVTIGKTFHVSGLPFKFQKKYFRSVDSAKKHINYFLSFPCVV